MLIPSGVRRTLQLLAFLTACGGPLDRDALHGEIEHLHALAAEARLLFERDVPRAFFTAHRAMLADKVHDAATKLADASCDARLEADRHTAGVLARTLERIVRTGDDPDAVLPIEHQLAAIDTRLAP